MKSHALIAAILALVVLALACVALAPLTHGLHEIAAALTQPPH